VGVQVASLLAFAILESWIPLSALTESTERRWGAHGLLFGCAVILQNVLVRVSPLTLAASIHDSPWGLLNRPALPELARILLAIVLLDGVHYLTDRLFHAYETTWRVHAVHHSDRECDVSTSLRLHPLEVIVSQTLYVAAIVLLTPPLLAVFLSGLQTILLNVLVHANIELPPSLERTLRLLFITPGLHRIHHSTNFADQNHNFGQAFSFWDRPCGTYRAHPTSQASGVEGVEHNN